MLRLNDWFCGAGGATQGAHTVPGVEPVLAANHNEQAIATHSANFPDVEHFRGDIKDLDVAGHPYAEIFWASPECTNWSVAKGKKVDYDGSKQPGLFGDTEIEDDVMRSRALMQDVIRYLEGMDLRQQPVLAGVVENVTDIRKWEHWHAWRSRIEKIGYRTRLIALNSMHAESTRAPRAPQSRDRLYLAYWHTKIGRDPDWDRWLRPSAHCPTCDRDVAAVQSWKKPGTDMGRYRQQYVYRCPTVSCRGQIVEPVFVPAAAAIDWTLPGTRIGDRAKPLADKTLARIRAGIEKYARPISLEAAGNTFERRPGVRTWPMDEPLKTLHTSASKALAVPPMLMPAGGTWNDTGQPLSQPMRARTTRETEGVLVPPLLVPVEGRDGKQAGAVAEHLRTMTTRNETGLLIPPFITELRGGGSDHRPISESLATITASGNHHGLVTMQAWAAMYGYDSGALRNHHQMPMPTQTTVQGDGVLTGQGLPAVEDCLFRMLEPHEIHAGMAFVPGYIVLGSKRDKVKQLGNAVTPPVAEVLVSALVECISGEPIERAA
ncbi:DNA cytosine methyltransferase [Kineosporia sp. NBRC 101731]|uniref:DNA cytosine methyltransferase n=1 Tax=Kineosporia sp. NBRC 101731 TaxID=3032199 RepID=UPI0024A0EB1C|nr:DNA cytosine methyltransferase [Kineosporia sp. NBRC 101731]GLY32014.1 DNA cytosine methyltransferase [Kineosporia sp. NBRC 101731]